MTLLSLLVSKDDVSAEDAVKMYLSEIGKIDLLDKIKSLTNPIDDEINSLISNIDDSNFSDIIKVCRRLLYKLPPGESQDREELISWRNKYLNILEEKYSSDLYSIEISDLKNIVYTKAEYSDTPNKVDGRIILRDNFDKILENKLYLGVLPIITISLTPEEIALMIAVRKIVWATIFITPAAKSELFGFNE